MEEERDYIRNESIDVGHNFAPTQIGPAGPSVGPTGPTAGDLMGNYNT